MNSKINEASSHQPAREKLDPALIKMAWILLFGTLAPLFDTTITNVAIHTLSQALNASVTTIQWVMTSYLLALGMVIPITGWAVDRFGGKRMWLFALAVFFTGSILCSLSWNVGSLIAFRAIQGIGGGFMMPIMQTMLVRSARDQKLGKLMAVAGLPALLGPILGPVLGGVIVENLNWRWIFFVNIPICLIAMIWAWRGLPEEENVKRTSRLDILGLSLISPALVLIIYGLAQVGTHHGFGHSEVLIPLLIGLLLLVSFVGYTLRKKESPLIDLSLFKVHSFTAASFLFFLSGLSTYGAMLLLPMYYQQIRGEGVLASGLLLMPQGIGMLLTRALAGKLTDQIGPRPVVLAGTLLTALGTWPFTAAGADTSHLLLAMTLVVRGAGLGGIFLPVMAASYQGLRKEQIPDASSASRIIQQVGGAFGASVLAVILQNQLDAHTAIDLAAKATSFNHTFLWSLGFTVIGLIPAAFLPGRSASSEGSGK
ncbi:MDR family MFS transporter [Gorillibacterium timonense]|uniref:MDR family MFS transporter n=1 Tax=Gorillibacterium timonense TaxID=1689269 RepID=UPI00071DD8D5|nr:MDR family MFS transporter [Gorillibacterium timonense]